MTKIEAIQTINVSKLSQQDYVFSLVREAQQQGMFSDFETQQLQVRLIELLADTCRRYTGLDSDSVRMETAEGILQSNLYLMGLYLKTLPPDSAVHALRALSMEELYRRGKQQGAIKLKTASHLYRLVIKNKIFTANLAYHSTLQGIHLFFREYDLSYFAQETPGNIDYPLCRSALHLSGVEYMQQYLSNLYLENQFCRYFQPAMLHPLLLGFDPGYADLLFNIFEVVLLISLGCIITGTSPFSLSLLPEDVARLRSFFLSLTPEELKAELLQALGALTQRLSIDSADLVSYLHGAIPKYTTLISHACRTDHFTQLFFPQAHF